MRTFKTILSAARDIDCDRRREEADASKEGLEEKDAEGREPGELEDG